MPLNGIVNDKMFADVKLHGNVKWVVLNLVRFAVLWMCDGREHLATTLEITHVGLDDLKIG